MPEFGVIFDVDGVLIDSYQAHFRSWQQMFRDAGISFDEAQFRATFGRTNRDIFRELFRGEISEADAARWSNHKETLYRELLPGELRPMPGALQLIDDLASAGVGLAVGSSGPRANVELTLLLLERESVFRSVVSGDDVRRGKPDPEVFQLAAQRLGLAPQSCLVVEDAPQGVTAANAARAFSVALTGTSSRAALSHARLVIDRLTELSPGRVLQLLADRGC